MQNLNSGDFNPIISALKSTGGLEKIIRAITAYGDARASEHASDSAHSKALLVECVGVIMGLISAEGVMPKDAFSANRREAEMAPSPSEKAEEPKTAVSKDLNKDAVYLEVRATPRFWEDATVDGEQDMNGLFIPFRSGEIWKPVIRLEDGQIMNWPAGISADIHYKVCDAGEYWLQNSDRERIAKWNDYYVPDDFLCHGSDGWGDYIIFYVNSNGLIMDWTRPEIMESDWPATFEPQTDQTNN